MAEGLYDRSVDRGAHAFVSYASDDAAVVGQLVEDLEALGIATWFDRRRLSPGVAWKEEIRDAIRGGAFFLACFSISAVARDRTFMREELAVAIEEMRMRSPRQSWFIPVRLDNCEIPDHPIGPAFSMRDVQWVDLSADWRKGVLGLASSIRPGREIANDIRRRVLESSFEPDVAGEALDTAIRLDPANSQLFVLRATMRLEQHDASDAANDCERAVALGSDLPETRLLQARALWIAGYRFEAIGALKTLLRNHPNCVFARYDLGAIFYDMGRLDEAIEQFSEALQHRHHSLALRRVLIRCYTHRRDHESLEAACLAALEDHDHPDIHEGLAFARTLGSGLIGWPLSGKVVADPTAARNYIVESLDRALRGDPFNVARMYRAAAMLGFIDLNDECAELATRALTVAPQSPVLRELLHLSRPGRSSESDTDPSLNRGHEERLRKDPVIAEERIPRLEDDDRYPYPVVRRYAIMRWQIQARPHAPNEWPQRTS